MRIAGTLVAESAGNDSWEGLEEGGGGLTTSGLITVAVAIMI